MVYTSLIFCHMSQTRDFKVWISILNKIEMYSDSRSPNCSSQVLVCQLAPTNGTQWKYLAELLVGSYRRKYLVEVPRGSTRGKYSVDVAGAAGSTPAEVPSRTERNPDPVEIPLTEVLGRTQQKPAEYTLVYPIRP